MVTPTLYHNKSLMTVIFNNNNVEKIQVLLIYMYGRFRFKYEIFRM